MKWVVNGNDIDQVEPRVKGDVVCTAPAIYNESLKLWPERAPILAAAPDLLEALEAMLDHGGTTRGEWMPMDQITQARAAIAKAKVRP